LGFRLFPVYFFIVEYGGHGGKLHDFYTELQKILLEKVGSHGLTEG
jgi:hypothetical protein